MPATSSSLGTADVALVWVTDEMAADALLIDEDLATDRGLETACLLSIFVDRRAEDDDTPPSGDPNDRRGWWADEFAEVAGDKIGSRLWLLDRAKRGGDVAKRAEEYVKEALAWMVEDRVTSSVSVEIDMDSHPNAMLIGVAIQKPNREALSLRFAYAWS